MVHFVDERVTVIPLSQERQLRHHLSTTKDRKEELLQLKKELSTISMTDEFARHAKLQRKINVIQDELAVETTNATNKATAYVETIDRDEICTFGP